jgi:hypothetical protein
MRVPALKPEDQSSHRPYISLVGVILFGTLVWSLAIVKLLEICAPH